MFFLTFYFPSQEPVKQDSNKSEGDKEDVAELAISLKVIVAVSYWLHFLIA